MAGENFEERCVSPDSPPPRRRRGLRRIAAILFAAALAAAAYLVADYLRFVDTPLAPLPAPATIDVPLGTPLAGVVRLLEAAGVRAGPLPYWRLLARQTGAAGKLQAGEYALEPGLTPRALLRKMVAGEVIQHRFTIVEGWTFAQLREALAREPGLRQTLAAIDDATLMRALGEPGTPPEGWFLPQTYSYVKGMSDLDLLRRAFLAMRQLLEREWAARAPELPLDAPYQALILASIVEKETARPEERPLIAAVFLSRLRLGMRLQTDPSVIYGLGAAYEGKLHRRDLDVDTPFNTYTRSGLPPTPIALPGAASLAAVLHPAATDALYFVARGDGSHEFSTTLEAHNRAVERYQLHHNP
jgi:UPF0755 protein